MNTDLYSKISKRIDEHYYDCIDAHDDIILLLKDYRRLHDINKKLQMKLINRVEAWILNDQLR